MNRRRTGRTRTEAGLTLLELLVALSLTALILAGLPTALSLARRALATVDVMTRDDADTAGVDVVARHLTQALVIYERGRDGRLQVLFLGQPAALNFVAAGTLGPAGGLFRFEVTTVPAASGRQAVDIMVAWSLYRPPAAANVPQPERRERVLIANATALTLAYYGAPRAGGTPEWSPTWPATDTIPDLVELRIVMPPERGSPIRTLRIPLRLKPGR